MAQAGTRIAAQAFEQHRLTGRPLLGRSAEAGVRSAATQDLERLLMRARRGPAWSRTNEYGSRHYLVRSDLSRELCLQAAQELDGALRMFEMRLGRLERGRWAHGDPVQAHLEVLRKRGFEWTPLEELLRLESETF